nr:antichymotrypsin-2-like [Leptinotarsa decemlineata]
MTLTLSVLQKSDKMIWFYLFVFFFTSKARSLTIHQALQEFSLGNHEFSGDIYEVLIKSIDNLVFSPLSAEIILGLTSEGTKGKTEKELVRALYLPGKKITEAAVSQLRLNVSSESLTLLSANRIFIGEHFKIETSFKNLAEDVYKSDVVNVDFSNSQYATDLINNWVAESTNNRIQNLIDPKSISSSTRIVLVNALYLSAKWSHPFSSRNTRKETFHITSNSSKIVDMMHSSSSGTQCKFLHSVLLRAKFLEMSYRDSNITMTFILPDAIDGLAEIERNPKDYLRQQDLISEKVDIALPKFTITTSIDFKKLLIELGVHDLFESTANLSGISKGERLLVDTIVQKAFINVTESGTEAAAATAVIGGLTAVFNPSRPIFTFKADHPFMYYIRETDSGVILFAGRFTN